MLTAEDVARLGATGPAARAAGVAEDVRTLHRAGFAAVTPERPSGDVSARLEQRALELWQSLALLDDALDGPVEPVAARAGTPARRHGGARVESPRGATTCTVAVEQGRIARLRLRTGSYANWPAVAHAAADNLLPDFPLINTSFELCYACVDR